MVDMSISALLMVQFPMFVGEIGLVHSTRSIHALVDSKLFSDQINHFVAAYCSL